MKSLSDKVVVITGAGSGIGRALALNLARKGSLLAAARAAALTAEDLEDMRVVSRGRDADGFVEGIVLSPQSGEIDVVLVRFSGFLGMFGKLIVLPWSDITVAKGQPLLIADIDAAAIEQAEEADLTRYDVAG